MIDSISTWYGIWVSILLRSSGPNTHAGPSFLLRKHFGFDRFDSVFGFDPTPFRILSVARERGERPHDAESRVERSGDIRFPSCKHRSDPRPLCRTGALGTWFRVEPPQRQGFECPQGPPQGGKHEGQLLNEATACAPSHVRLRDSEPRAFSSQTKNLDFRGFDSSIAI